MAFKKEYMGFIDPMRGGSGIMTYTHPSDTIATIEAAAYWAASGVAATREPFEETKAFLIRQRLKQTAAGAALTATQQANQRVALIISSGASGTANVSKTISLRMTDTGLLRPD